MTKVSVFGQKSTESKQLKPIQFEKSLTVNGDLFDFSRHEPKLYDNVQLLFDKAFGNYDVMLVWNNGSSPYVVLGHWNDGVI